MISGVKIRVDFSDRLQEVRDQGLRPTCLAIASSDVHMVAHDMFDSLSAEGLHFFARQYSALQGVDAITVDEAKMAIRNDGQPLESDWPYEPIVASKHAVSCSKYWCGSLESKGGYDSMKILQELDNNRPVLLVVRVSAAFDNLDTPWVIESHKPGFALHALVAVGYGEDESGALLVKIRNSWGEGWGEQGHAWLTESYLQQELVEWLVIPGVV